MSTPAQVLIVEDEHALGAALALAARRIGCVPGSAASGTAALDQLSRQRWDAVVLDIGLPDMSGLEVLAQLRQRDAALPVLVITAHATLEHALKAQQRGGTLYLPKPLDLAQFESALQTLLSGRGVEVARAASARPAAAVTTLIGRAPAMQPVFLGIARACAAKVPVLITGPSGSGKSLTAAIIHAHRGGEGDWFSGDGRQLATRSSLEAWLEACPATGTGVLEEVDALEPAAQSALAARWAAGTTPPLLLTTRADPSLVGPEFGLVPELFYAVSACVIRLPPLRQRASDIPALAAFFLGLRGAGAQVMTAPALAALLRYDWPGNVRELRHVLDSAAALSHDGRLFAGHLPAPIAGLTAEPENAVLPGDLEDLLGRWLDQNASAAYDDLLDVVETTLLRHLLERHEGKVTHLATAHRLNRATLRQKIRRLGLDAEREEDAAG